MRVSVSTCNSIMTYILLVRPPFVLRPCVGLGVGPLLDMRTQYLGSKTN
jgi:hypothetical protein